MPQLYARDVSISLGSSKSQSQTTQTSDSARGSNVAAGSNLTITATGAGQDSDIAVQGSKLSAGNQAVLDAQDQINLLAAANTSTQQSTNKSKSGSVGVTMGTSGVGVTASASIGRGKADGNDVTWTNTQVNAGNAVDMTSGSDTTVKGAVVTAPSITANVGGNLTIESLQDTSTYDSRQQSISGSVTVGASTSGNVSFNKSKVDSDYASVTQQSGLRAGDGGFDVNVGNNTTLTGGAITSTQAAINNGRNRFTTGGELTTSDIENRASYEAKSVGINVGSGINAQGKLAPSGTGAGLGSDSGSAASVTTASISGIAGNKDARAGDNETGIGRIFDVDKVQREIDAQTTITQTFGREASKAVASYAASQIDDIKKQREAELKKPAPDAEKLKALGDELQKWDEGGTYRVALHMAVGGLSGGAQGAAGVGAAAAVAPLLNDLQDSLAKNLEQAGANGNVAKAAAQLVTGMTAAGIGSVASGGSAAGAMTAFNADTNNRQLHPTEAQLIKENAARYAQRRGGISIAQAEAELTQQSLRNFDSAHDQRLGADNAAAQAFLQELGAGQAAVDPLTGQRFELFAADAATRDNHTMFGQYAKLSSDTRSALDRAYDQAFKPGGAQTIAGLNGTNAGALTGSDLALNDAARDLQHMRNQPQVVQWAVLSQLRQERANNLQTQQQLLAELQGMNQRGETGTQAAQRRGEIVNQLTQLEYENQTLRQASVEQLKAMGSAGTTNPARHREWSEGSGEAIAASRLSFAGMSAASLGARINMLKGAVQEVQAASAVAKAEAQAVAKARVESNARNDDAQQYDHFRKPDSARSGGEWDWQKQAPNGGTVPGTQQTITVQSGAVLDRFGYRGGEYMSPAGTPFDARALPPGKLADPYEKYIVLKSFSVTREQIAPAFGQVGGGTQMRAVIPEVSNGFATINDLIKHGYLKDPTK